MKLSTRLFRLAGGCAVAGIAAFTFAISDPKPGWVGTAGVLLRGLIIVCYVGWAFSGLRK